ncbi:MAG: hypothetical protein D6679_11715 [Candidatus Hydrogenedentota bacterium]|nr:MAG: hypothetical protein D6679_11715 [Candidatus Hydrogenedentota bacterium]
MGTGEAIFPIAVTLHRLEDCEKTFVFGIAEREEPEGNVSCSRPANPLWNPFPFFLLVLEFANVRSKEGESFFRRSCCSLPVVGKAPAKEKRD